PEAGPVVGIHRQHRVEQHAVVIALADFPKRAPALRGGVEVDLTGVLDRQHVAASHRGDRGFAPAFDDPLRCHLVVAEEALNRTSCARSPLESHRRQTSLPATMRPTSAAPLYRDDDPRTGLTSSLSVTTWRHSIQLEALP